MAQLESMCLLIVASSTNLEQIGHSTVKKENSDKYRKLGDEVRWRRLADVGLGHGERW